VGRSTLNNNVCQYFFVLNLDIIMFGSTESVVTTTTEDLLALKYPLSIENNRNGRADIEHLSYGKDMSK
jgi:hypothetical protein